MKKNSDEEQLRRTFKTYDIETYFKPFTKKQLVCSPQTPLKKKIISVPVYRIYGLALTVFIVIAHKSEKLGAL